MAVTAGARSPLWLLHRQREVDVRGSGVALVVILWQGRSVHGARVRAAGRVVDVDTDLVNGRTSLDVLVICVTGPAVAKKVHAERTAVVLVDGDRDVPAT